MSRYLFPTAPPGGYSKLLVNLLLGLVAMLMPFLAGCATVGRDFPVGRVSDIGIRETTQDEIRAMFGSPWRVGIEDGRRTWTYGKYRYRLFGQASTQDLVIRFNERNIVVSYTFNTTEHQE
jgi:hypothetical protein